MLLTLQRSAKFQVMHFLLHTRLLWSTHFWKTGLEYWIQIKQFVKSQSISWFWLAGRASLMSWSLKWCLFSTISPLRHLTVLRLCSETSSIESHTTTSCSTLRWRKTCCKFTERRMKRQQNRFSVKRMTQSQQPKSLRKMYRLARVMTWIPRCLPCSAKLQKVRSQRAKLLLLSLLLSKNRHKSRASPKEKLRPKSPKRKGIGRTVSRWLNSLWKCVT